MKRNFTKLVAVFLALTVLLTCGVSVFAHDYDYDHIQSGYGSKSGTDLGNANWSLAVTPYYAESYGNIFNGYTGSIFCAVIASDVWSELTASNYCNRFLYGDGSWAEIWFYDVV